MSDIESVFHAYDIRGVSPDVIDEDFARRLGNACVAEFSPSHVCIGRDMRGTSVHLEKELIDALLAHGVNVTRIGLCSTPMFHVSVGLANGTYDLGIMVTASHNPAEFNGFKFVRGDVSPIGQGNGMEELKNAFFEHGDDTGSGGRGELTDDKDALKTYVSYMIKLAKLPPDMPKMRVALDAGNGMAGVVLPELIQRLPWLHVEPLFFDLDGTFPNHEANPLKTETLSDLANVISAGTFDCGASFDGDADRVGFMDELGVPVSGDFATAILARQLLHVHPGKEILYDVRSSWIVPETIRAVGGMPTMCRVGHSFIKQQMRETHALFGGEVSIHYYFSDLYNVESGDLSLLLLLKEMVHEGKSLSAVAQDLRVYAHSGEINFRVRDPQHTIFAIQNEYANTATENIDIDGIRMEFRDTDHPELDWWFSIRASNTEPLLRLNLETRSEERTKEMIKILSKKIRLV